MITFYTSTVKKHMAIKELYSDCDLGIEKKVLNK
jgi:hypothetical protein